MHSAILIFLSVIFFELFEQNAGWQSDRKKYVTGNKKKFDFGLGKAFDNLETHQHFEKRGTGDKSRYLPKESDNKRDVSQLQLICSFIPESYISMENVSGKLTPVKKIRHVPLCCPGYQRVGSGNEEDYKCVPACGSCTHGLCVSPNRCKCDDGYENPSSNFGTCVPKCYPRCKNSYCASPDTCVCEKGFEPDEFFPNQCTKTSEPVTNPPSTVSTTIVPQPPRLNLKFVCGFSHELYKETVKNGTEESIRPGILLVPVCCPGFKRSGIICVPHCEGGCGEGVCKYPGMCVCEKKFQYCHFGNYSRPRPSRFQNITCLEKCKNGVCLSNNTCQCNQGFRHQDDWTNRYTSSSTECVPYCFPFCSNKWFSTPEQCECSYSYVNDDSMSIELDVNKPKSFKHLKKLFNEYGHPNFGTGAGLDIAAGLALGSRGKSKQELSNSRWIVGGGNSGLEATALRGMYDNRSHSVPGSNNFGSNSSEIGISGRRATGWVIPGNNNLGSSSSGIGTSGNRVPGWVIPGNNHLGSSSSSIETSGSRGPGWVIPGNNNLGLSSSGIETSGSRGLGWVIPGNNNLGSSSAGIGTSGNRAPGWVIPGNNNLGSSSSSIETSGSRGPGWVIPENNNLGSSSSGIGTSGNRAPGWVIPGNNNLGSSSSGIETSRNRYPRSIIPGNILGSSSSRFGTNGNKPGWDIPGSNNLGFTSSRLGTNGNRPGWVIPGNNNLGSSSSRFGTNGNRPGWVIPGSNNLGSTSSRFGTNGNRPHGTSNSGISSGNWPSDTNYRPQNAGRKIPGIRPSSGLSGIGRSSSSGGRGSSGSLWKRKGGGRLGERIGGRG